MRSLLCGLLSIVLLVNSTTPALAQVVSGGRAVSRSVAQAGKRGVTSSRGASHTLANLATGTGQFAAANRALQHTSVQVTHLQQRLSNTVQYQNWLSKTSLSSLAVSGQYDRAAQHILSLPLSQQIPLLRNEFVLLHLLEKVSVPQRLKVHRFLREDIQQKLPAFESVAGQSLETVFEENTGKAQAAVCREVLSSAAALAFLGTAEDAGLFVALHQAAAKGPFEEVATRLTGRGLLRLQAYEAFNQWAEPLSQEGEFWLGVAAYARRNRLPVSLHPAVTVRPVQEVPGLAVWLEKGNVLNGLNAKDSIEATEKWLETGRKSARLQETAATFHQPSAPLPKEAPVRPDLASFNPLLVSSNTQITSAVLPNQPAAVQPAAAAAAQTPSNAGVLYSGVPVFALWNKAGRAWNRLSKLWSKKPVVSLPVEEEPGLHDNTVRPVYERVQPPMGVEADEVQALAEAPGKLEVAESGFKLTFENEEGIEHILSNVDLTIDTAFKTEGYNRIVLKKDAIFELRNLTQPAGKMSHFFFKLSNQNGELYQLASALSQMQLYRPMHIKLESKPNLRYTFSSLNVVDFETGRSFNLQASVDEKLLPAGTRDGKLLLARDGSIYFAAEGNKPVLLKNFYVRLPKEESGIWMNVLKDNPQMHFNLAISSTRNKTNLMTYVVSPLRIGTGKAFGPIMSSLGLSPFLATGIPLFANNGLTILLGPMMPFLRRIGEANMYRLGVGLYAAASMGALTLGLNGFMGIENATSLQVGGLIGVLLSMGFGGVLINVTQNNLVSRNAGAVKAARGQKNKSWVGDPTAVPTLAHLGHRFKEVLTARNVEMRDSVRYQWLSAFKNVGTFGFLALPFFFNLASQAVGSSLRADFSLSFWPLAALSSYALYKVLKMPIKDSVPRNTSMLQKIVLETEHDLIARLTKELGKPQADWNFEAIAKQLNGALTPYAYALSHKLGKKQADISIDLEKESLQRIQKGLLAQTALAEKIPQAMEQLQHALDVLGRRNMSPWRVMKMPGVVSSLGAMTLLTVHELGTSSEFAYQVGAVANAKLGLAGADGAATGMFLTAFFLYGSSFFSRIAGNWVALRTSEGSMYAFSSLMSLLGSTLLIAADNSLPLLFTGATMATFGMGNFFSQVFEHTIKQAPKFRPELAVLIGYTMPLGAGLSSGMHALAEWGASQGVSNLGLIASLGALVASFAVCPKMFANSSLIRSAQYYGQKMWQAARNMFIKKTQQVSPESPSDQAEALAQ